MSGKRQHGGKREGAGRKPTFKKQVLVRVEPSTERKIRSEAKAKGKTLGEVIDEKFS